MYYSHSDLHWNKLTFTYYYPYSAYVNLIHSLAVRNFNNKSSRRGCRELISSFISHGGIPVLNLISGGTRRFPENQLFVSSGDMSAMRPLLHLQSKLQDSGACHYATQCAVSDLTGPMPNDVIDRQRFESENFLQWIEEN